MSWRFIKYSLADAALNMALDEAILEAHLAGRVPPTLRLYGFSPPAVSIGLSQEFPEHLVASIRNRGMDVVRRPTGGRAVLHLNDLTYSFVGSTVGNTLEDTEPGKSKDTCQPFPAQPAGQGSLSTSVLKAYKEISAGLKEALALLSLDVEMGNAHAAYRQLQDCFLSTTGSDLHYQGTKICGSAQLRRRSAVLQHGSLLLDQDQSLMSDILNAPVNPESRRHANLFEIAGRSIDFLELNDIFRRGFETAFGVPFLSSDLTDAEMEDALARRVRYASLSVD